MGISWCVLYKFIFVRLCTGWVPPSSVYHFPFFSMNNVFARTVLQIRSKLRKFRSDKCRWSQSACASQPNFCWFDTERSHAFKSWGTFYRHFKARNLKHFHSNIAQPNHFLQSQRSSLLYKAVSYRCARPCAIGPHSVKKLSKCFYCLQSPKFQNFFLFLRL
jgi:hypothetical protein